MTTAVTTEKRFVELGKLHLEHAMFLNPRTLTGLDDKEIAALGEDIKERDLQVPPKVQQIKWNNLIIDLVIDGQRRVKGALTVWPKNRKIEVSDRTAEPLEMTRELADELMLDALAIGQKREGLSSFELSEVAESMRSRENVTLDDISKAIGKSPSWISKMLKARATASPKLLGSWRSKKISDEMFKDLASVSPVEQTAGIETALATRETGDKAEARTQAKELAAKAKSKDKDKTKATNGHTPVVSGEQTHMWEKPPAVKEKKTGPAKAMLEDLSKLAEERPPTHDYAKGVLEGVQWTLGHLEEIELGKPWRAYLDRLAGKPKAAKKSKKTKKAAKKSKPAKKAKARKR